MAKAITLADLNNALKPILEALNKLREESTTCSSQISETHAMVTNISVKIDTLEQTAGATLSEISKPVTRKTTAPRKAAAPRKAPAKAPTKRGTKATTEDTTEADEDADNAEDATEAEEDVEPETPVNKKAAIKTAKPVAKAPAKTTVKKTTAVRLNKMTIFKEMFKSDPSKFDKYLTNKVKKEIEAANKKWSELEDEQLANAKRTAYYHYMKDNHNEVLEEFKAEYANNEEEE